MTLFGLILALVVFGVLLYLVQLVPMDATVKRIIYVVAIVAIILWLVLMLLGHPAIDRMNPRLW